MSFLNTSLESIPLHIYAEHVKRNGNVITHTGGLTFATTILGASMKTVCNFLVYFFHCMFREYSSCMLSSALNIIIFPSLKNSNYSKLLLYLHFSLICIFVHVFLLASYPAFGVHDSSIEYPSPGRTIVQSHSGVELCSGIPLLIILYHYLRYCLS